jgi:hypothetical protein
MYEIGKVYIWKKNLPAPFTELSGTETTVLSGPSFGVSMFTRSLITVWKTDSSVNGIFGVLAEAGDLYPKDPPDGLKSVLKMFEKTPELEPA